MVHVLSLFRQLEKRWCLCKITLIIIYIYIFFFTVSQYNYTQLKRTYTISLYSLCNRLLMCLVFGLDDCCSALFSLFDGDGLCVLIEKDSDQRLVKTKLIVEPLNGLLVASATIASQ